jgi:hypothetical protein
MGLVSAETLSEIGISHCDVRHKALATQISVKPCH